MFYSPAHVFFPRKRIFTRIKRVFQTRLNSLKRDKCLIYLKSAVKRRKNAKTRAKTRKHAKKPQNNELALFCVFCGFFPFLRFFSGIPRKSIYSTVVVSRLRNLTMSAFGLRSRRSVSESFSVTQIDELISVIDLQVSILEWIRIYPNTSFGNFLHFSFIKILLMFTLVCIVPLALGYTCRSIKINAHLDIPK